ncbi:hypothetical protein D9M69_620750 [compost metagenome]
MVEHRGVGEGGLFGDWRILPLALAVGGESVEVEGDDGSPRTLSAINAFDCRMQARQRLTLAADQAQSLAAVAIDQ